MLEPCGCKCDAQTGDMQIECDFHLALRKDAERYRFLRDNYLTTEPATRDGPAHPVLVFRFDIWALNKESHNRNGLDAAIDAKLKS